MAMKVTIQIGPISASAKVLTAVRDETESDLKTVCVGDTDDPHDAAKVNSQFKCSACERTERSYHPYPRGRDNGDGTFTVISREDHAEASKLSADVLETLTFFPAPREQVEKLSLPYGKVYRVGPTALRPEMYGLCRDIMRQLSDRFIFVTQWAPKSAPMWVQAIFMGDLIGIQQLAEPASVVAPPEVNLPDYDERFLNMGVLAAETLVIDFNPHTFVDTRKTKIAELLAGTGSVAALSPGATSTGVDATEAQLVSLEAWVTQNSKTVGAAGKTAKKPTRSRRPAAAKVKEKVPA